MSDLLAADHAERADVDLVDDREFFAPVSSDLIDTLIGQHQDMRARIERMAELVNADQSAVQHFLEGNSDPDRRYSGLAVEKLFEAAGAIANLNSQSWGRALSLTDVYDCMPQARRDEWNEQLRNPQGKKKHQGRYEPEAWDVPPLPDFEETTVRDTLAGLLTARSKFFAERVDGIFRGLSGEHVTNSPAGFGKRMIVGWMLSYGSIRHERAGLINDLRCVIAKFMGRDEPKYSTAAVLISELYRCTGQWVSIDGGTLRIRVYKKGTAHLEVHPDMAWRLNQVLANLYPLAIPAEFRARPKKQAKEFLMMGRPLPFATLDLLAAGLKSYGARDRVATRFALEASAKEQKAAHRDACAVLAALGGTPNTSESWIDAWDFDYPIEPVLEAVIITGCLPDRQAHQFYPTPEKLGRICAELAEIGEHDTVLEPSAGQGDLAAFLPKARTTCVEISPLHCAVLKAKGFDAVQADFLAWNGPQFSAAVMNPPFSDGRAQAHVQHAATMIKPGGRLVAILPASARGKDWVGSGWACEWTSIYEREFAGTSVSVVILKAVRT